jgi:hypothetical protein
MTHTHTYTRLLMNKVTLYVGVVGYIEVMCKKVGALAQATTNLA